MWQGVLPPAGAATGPGVWPWSGAACGLVAAADVRPGMGVTPPMATSSSLSLALGLVAVLDVRALGLRPALRWALLRFVVPRPSASERVQVEAKA